jgi:hypothetical protein
VAQPTGYGYGKQITISNSNVVGGANLTNFPVLISFTDINLRTVANSGHVQNSGGYDIIFTTSDCLTQLSHQIERYVSTTGEYVAWVRIPTLSASSNTIIHMYYGNSSVTTDPSVTTVWDSNYKSVWHFSNSINDNTANGNNLTDNSTSNNTSGKIGSARNLSNGTNVLSSSTSAQYLALANNYLASITNFTYEGWVYLNRATTNWERIFDFGQSTTVNFFLTPSSGTAASSDARARITTSGNGGEQGPVSASTTNTGSWIHWAVVIDASASTMTLYRNGSSTASASSVTLRPQNMESSTGNYFGRSKYTSADHYIDAAFDEFRISTTARTAGWIGTSYNNQNSPSTFYTVASEVASSSLCSALPISLLYFSATPENDKVRLQWATASELNNDYFTIERSADGKAWEEIERVAGAGNSFQRMEYTAWDEEPVSKTSYYRLKQTDYDEQFTYSQVHFVKTTSANEIQIYYSMLTNELIVEAQLEDSVSNINISDALGHRVLLPYTTDSGKTVFSAAGLPAGIYIVQVYTGEGVKAVKIQINH